MKKMLVLLLGVLLLVPTFAACSPDLKDKGALIPVYFAGQLTNVDPTQAYYEEANAEVVSLLYECMTTINEKGEVELAAAEKYTIVEDVANNTYSMEFVLKENRWSDNRNVSADDFAFAWRRVLDPTFRCEAAPLLFDIKNAKAYANNELEGSKYEVGIVPDDDKLTIYFDGPIDYDRFLRNLSALALAPLREDMVSQNEHWSMVPSLAPGNGPFVLKKFTYGTELVLERNSYYYRDAEKDEYYDIVTPYRLIVDLSQNADAQFAKYQLEKTDAAKVWYLGNFSNATAAANLADMEVTDTMTVHSYFFNTTKAPFDDANVRRALSLALDRAAIAAAVPLTKAATGFVTPGVVDTTSGTSFAEQSGTLLTYNLAEAQTLIAAANLTASEKSFSISYREGDEVATAIATLAKTAWDALGFNVKLDAKKASAKAAPTKEDYPYVKDDHAALIDSGKFDVIAIDYQMPTTDAFAALAPFAPAFSGGAIPATAGVEAKAAHFTGYQNPAYETLIAAALATRNPQTRATILHDAERMLMNDMPVIPIVTLQKGYLADKDLKKLSVNFRGFVMFDKAELKNYEDYQTSAAQ